MDMQKTFSSQDVIEAKRAAARKEAESYAAYQKKENARKAQELKDAAIATRELVSELVKQLKGVAERRTKDDWVSYATPIKVVVRPKSWFAYTRNELSLPMALVGLSSSNYSRYGKTELNIRLRLFVGFDGEVYFTTTNQRTRGYFTANVHDEYRNLERVAEKLSKRKGAEHIDVLTDAVCDNGSTAMETFGNVCSEILKSLASDRETRFSFSPDYM